MKKINKMEWKEIHEAIASLRDGSESVDEMVTYQMAKAYVNLISYEGDNNFFNSLKAQLISFLEIIIADGKEIKYKTPFSKKQDFYVMKNFGEYIHEQDKIDAENEFGLSQKDRFGL